MSVLDKFLNAMKLNDDDLDEEEFEERPAKKHIFKKNDMEEEFDEFDDFDEPIIKKSFQPKAKSRQSSVSVVPNNKISPIRPKKTTNMEVCIIKPRSMEDAREITETLISNRTVVLNMEGLDMEIAQRIIDFSSGSCFAIDGNLQKISNYIFIITPSTVDVSGDFQEILSGAFDVPAIRTGY